ncbi:MAG: NAD(P)H-hydrate dehydratase [Lachnospiraceae bacterium]|nr:NAD(P)H-hydrate dehydratase [Lachnospiraceae bacterium]
MVQMRALQESQIKNLLPKRIADSNKGTYGRLLDIAGQKECAGCAILSAFSALRTGVGMVRVLSHKNNFIPLMNTVPEVLFSSDRNSESVCDSMDWATAVLIGPGIGRGRRAEEMLDTVLMSENMPLVIDADGINLISNSGYLREELRDKAQNDPVILTPHLMEMSRFTGRSIAEIKQDMQGIAAKYAADYQVVIALKDARTVTVAPDGRAVLNTTGNNGMSTAGSGDVLAGIVASFLAQGLDAFDAAALGVYIHGAAGDAAAEKYGVRGMKAMDIAEALPEVLLKADSMR